MYVLTLGKASLKVSLARGGTEEGSNQTRRQGRDFSLSSGGAVCQMRVCGDKCVLSFFLFSFCLSSSAQFSPFPHLFFFFFFSSLSLSLSLSSLIFHIYSALTPLPSLPLYIRVTGTDCGEAAASWLTEALSRDCRLVRQTHQRTAKTPSSGNAPGPCDYYIVQ